MSCSLPLVFSHVGAAALTNQLHSVPTYACSMVEAVVDAFQHPSQPMDLEGGLGGLGPAAEGEDNVGGAADTVHDAAAAAATVTDGGAGRSRRGTQGEVADATAPAAAATVPPTVPLAAGGVQELEAGGYEEDVEEEEAGAAAGGPGEVGDDEVLPLGVADGTQPSQAPPESYDLMVSEAEN